MNATPAIPARWAWHQRALTQLRQVLLRERDERGAAIRSPLPRGGADQVDVANDENEHDHLLAEISHENAELAEIDAALERIRLGTYGVCEATDEPINAERLRAIPWTRYSQAAAARLERDRASSA